MDKKGTSKNKIIQKINKLEAYSPERVSKTGQSNTTYTPNRAVNDMIHREIISIKKVQQNNSKIRQTETFNSILKQKVRHLQEQRGGIEESLNQQIAMYKKMIKQLQKSNQERIKQLQKGFSIEIQVIIQQKQQEAKYFQNQKQLMESRICQLQNMMAQMKDQFNTVMNDFQKLSSQNEKLLEDVKKLTSKNQQLQRNKRSQTEKYQKQMDQLKKSLNDLSQANTRELQREKEKFNKTLADKQKNIENLNKMFQEQRQKLHQMSKSNAAQYSNLLAEKKQLKDALQKSNYELQRVRHEINQVLNSSTVASDKYQRIIKDLKKRIQQNQIIYQKQKQNWGIQAHELRQQILILRKNVQKNGFLLNDNNLLNIQIKKLQELLYETSVQLQRFKGQFTRQDLQKETLAKKLRELDVQNEFLYKQKLEMEDQANSWRQSYYKSRR